MENALHFVGFRRDENRLQNARKVWGNPDFIHFYWDYRAVYEIMPGDTVIFAVGDETETPNEHAYNDSENC